MEWNYVEQSLPNDGEIVLVYDNSPYAHGYGATTQFGMYNSKDNSWKVWIFYTNKCNKPEITIIDNSWWFVVTHWAKFPVPKEE